MTHLVRLGELFRVGSSKRVLKSQWRSAGVPFYRGREVTRLAADGFVENELFISESLYEELSSQYGVPDADDIMITAIGTIGNSYVVRKGDRFYFKDASVLWLKKTAEVSSEFINYWLRSDEFFEQLDRGNGATVDTLTIQKLQSVGIELPPVPEQRLIVAILDEAFEGIATAKANAEKNLQNIREMFRLRLRSIFGAVNGLRISAGWYETRIKELGFVQSGAGFPLAAQGLVDGGIPFYKVSDMNIPGNEREMIYENNSITEQVRRTLGASLFPSGSVIFPKIGGAIATNKKRIATRDCCVDNNVMGVVPRVDRVNPKFLFYFFLAHDLSEFANEAHLPSIRKTVVEEWKVWVPRSLDEQRRIASEVEALEDHVQSLERVYVAKLDALEELKKSLLHRAFTGALQGLSR
jgi:type I restriction enzyme S subunit